jgi:hypothetical protein
MKSITLNGSKMARNLLILICAVIGMISCKKDNDENGGKPNGIVTCTITSPKDGDELFINDDITVRIDAKDSKTTIAELMLYLDDVQFPVTLVEPYTVTIPSMFLHATLGKHTIKAVATNTEGVSAEAIVTVNVTGNDGGTEIASGTTGALTWKLTNKGTLTISGNGEMPHYPQGVGVPWAGYRTSIHTVIMGSGITRIGSSAFWSCVNLTSATIPSTVTSIGGYAFSYCYNLTSLINHNPVPVDISVSVFYMAYPGKCTLKVPTVSVSTYKNAPMWKDFKVVAL